MSQHDLIGIFGGTFDPIHNGHINSVLSLGDELDFETIYLLPSSTPPHRPATASTAADRLKMVELAIAGHSRLKADDRESISAGKSYTINTLKSYRSQFPDHSLAFVAGMDAYLSMPTWKQWQAYLDFAHIIVLNRPGYNALDDAWGRPHLTNDKYELVTTRSGKIYYANSMLVDISSTQIRRKLISGQTVDDELPAAVINYIETKQLYVHN